MTWDSPVTYWLDLDQLTNESATFRHYVHDNELSGVVVRLPRDAWQEMGRPGRITAAPWRADGAR